MPKAYLTDVKEAILAADQRFSSLTVGNFQQHFEVATVNVIAQQVGNRWDYGHPTMYVMWDGNIAALETWWNECYPNGVVLPKVWKPMLGCYEVNVQRTAGNRLFNYHVAVGAL